MLRSVPYDVGLQCCKNLDIACLFLFSSYHSQRGNRLSWLRKDRKESSTIQSQRQKIAMACHILVVNIEVLVDERESISAEFLLNTLQRTKHRRLLKTNIRRHE